MTITGGEPMLHRNFFEIVEEIHRQGMYVNELNTNGSLIDQAALDRLKAIGCHPVIKISFDGLGHHHWLRSRPGAEARALTALRLCVENGFPVWAQTNVHRLNTRTMLPTAELLDEIGVSEMRVIRTTEAPRWKENASGACLTLEEYFEKMLRFTVEYLKSPGRWTWTSGGSSRCFSGRQLTGCALWSVRRGNFGTACRYAAETGG